MCFWIKKIIRILYIKINVVYDFFTSKNVVCSIGDLMLLRSEMYENQFLVSSRVLDIKDYFFNKSTKFNFQTQISLSKYGEKKYKANYYNEKFIELIKSYQKEGYKEGTPLLADKFLRLMDGNHRLACNYFFEMEKVSVKFVKRRVPYRFGIDCFVDCRLSSDLLRIVFDEYKEIQKKLVSRGDCFCFFSDDSEIAQSLHYVARVLKQVQVDLKNDLVLSDGVAVHSGKYCLVLFSLPNPNYYCKGNRLFSARIDEIRKILMKKKNIERDSTELLLLTDSCLEGFLLYNQLKPFLRESNMSEG